MRIRFRYVMTLALLARFWNLMNSDSLGCLLFIFLITCWTVTVMGIHVMRFRRRQFLFLLPKRLIEEVLMDRFIGRTSSGHHLNSLTLENFVSHRSCFWFLNCEYIILKNTFIYFIGREEQSSFSVLNPSIPEAFVITPIFPIHFTIPLSLVTNKITLVNIARFPIKLPFAVLCVVQIRSNVLIP